MSARVYTPPMSTDTIHAPKTSKPQAVRTAKMSAFTLYQRTKDAIEQEAIELATNRSRVVTAAVLAFETMTLTQRRAWVRRAEDEVDANR